MGLSTDLISQFVKNTNDSEKKKEEIVVYGTVTSDGERYYVQIDGSSESTPINTTTEVNVGDRVLVTVKNHTATITGNITDPAVGTKRAGNIESSISQTAESISLAVKEINGLSGSLAELTVSVGNIKSTVSSNTNELSGIKGSISTIEQTAKGISSTVETHYNELTAFKGTVDSELSGVKSSISTIEQTANGISTTVESNHKAFTDFQGTVNSELSGVKSSISTIEQTANGITTRVESNHKAFTDFQGTVNSELSGVKSSISTIEQTANGITTRVESVESTNKSFSEFKQTIEEFSFMGKGGNVKISGGDITLTGAIKFTDLETTVQSTISTASTNATSAVTTANSAQNIALEAYSKANSVQLPSYIKSTYIDFSTVMSPKIIGAELYATDGKAWTSMSSDGLRIYTGGIRTPKIELLNYSNAVQMILGSGDTDGNGRFSITKDIDSVVMKYESPNSVFIFGALVFQADGSIVVRRGWQNGNTTSTVLI